MLKKICSSPENNIVARHDQQEILANPKLVRRFSKLANRLRTIAPKSDDFLYFSIYCLLTVFYSLISFIPLRHKLFPYTMAVILPIHYYF